MTPAPQGLRYDTLWQRLIANTAEPDSDNGCWPWTGKKCSSYGYGRLNLYVPELAANRPVTAHVLAWARRDRHRHGGRAVPALP